MANDFKEEYFSLALEVGAKLHGVWGGGEGRGGEGSTGIQLSVFHCDSM